MKVTVIGSHLCPDTLYALNKLVEAKADITFQNLSARNAGIANPPHTFLHTELFQNQGHLMMKFA